MNHNRCRHSGSVFFINEQGKWLYRVVSDSSISPLLLLEIIIHFSFQQKINEHLWRECKKSRRPLTYGQFEYEQFQEWHNLYDLNQLRIIQGRLWRVSDDVTPNLFIRSVHSLSVHLKILSTSMTPFDSIDYDVMLVLHARKGWLSAIRKRLSIVTVLSAWILSSTTFEVSHLFVPI